MGLPQKILAKRMRKWLMRRNSRSGARITYSLEGIPFIDLGNLVKQQNGGVRVGRKFFKGLFLAEMRGGGGSRGYSRAGTDHRGVFLRHEKAAGRRSRDKRRVRAVNNITGKPNKNPGKLYRASLPIKEPTKNLNFLQEIIIRQSRQIVRTEFARIYRGKLQYEVIKTRRAAERRARR